MHLYMKVDVKLLRSRTNRIRGFKSSNEIPDDQQQVMGLHRCGTLHVNRLCCDEDDAKTLEGHRGPQEAIEGRACKNEASHRFEKHCHRDCNNYICSHSPCYVGDFHFPKLLFHALVPFSPVTSRATQSFS
jgi:hypothetical protein